MSMLASLSTAPKSSPEQTGASTADDWQAVQTLIEEIGQDQNQDLFKRSLVEWQLAVRQFRKVELHQMVLREPDETDLRFHAICLRSLLAMGETLEVWSRSLDAEALADIQIGHDDIRALVEDLKLGLREWHHSYPPEELKRLQNIIFGGTA
jgi:hypothetical protein